VQGHAVPIAHCGVVFPSGSFGDDRHNQLAQMRVEVEGLSHRHDVGAGRIWNPGRVGVHRTGQGAAPRGFQLSDGSGQLGADIPASAAVPAGCVFDQ
jgi:hypothetical protein